MDKAAKSNYDSDGFHAHLYLSSSGFQQPTPKRWEAAYHFPKQARVITQKSRWKTAKTTVRTVILGGVPKQLELDFSQQAGAEVSGQPSALTRLEEAANKGSETAFLKGLSEISWQEKSVAECVHLIKLAFRTGAFGAARYITAGAAKCYPDNAEIQKYVRVLLSQRRATPEIEPQPNTRANRNWLEEHAGEYRGQWVALRNGELLGVANSLPALIDEVKRKYGVTFPSKEIMVTTGY